MSETEYSHSSTDEVPEVVETTTTGGGDGGIDGEVDTTAADED